MIITAAAAAGTAVFQFFADVILFRSVFSGKIPKALGALFIKLAVYGAVFALLFLRFRGYAVGAAAGFGIGFFPALFIYGFYTLKQQNNKANNNKVTGGVKPLPDAGGGE